MNEIHNIVVGVIVLAFLAGVYSLITGDRSLADAAIWIFQYHG